MVIALLARVIVLRWWDIAISVLIVVVRRTLLMLLRRVRFICSLSSTTIAAAGCTTSDVERHRLSVIASVIILTFRVAPGSQEVFFEFVFLLLLAFTLEIAAGRL